MRPGGATLNTIHAGLVRMDSGWHGVIRAAWNAPAHLLNQNQTTVEESVLGADTLLIWRPANIRAADEIIVDAAWRLGAWDVRRIWCAPLGANADPFATHHGLIRLFDPSGAHAVRDDPMSFRGDQIDVKALVETASRDGWVSWRFRPTQWSARVGGKVAARDVTLAIDGTRVETSPYSHQALIQGEQLTISLGREETQVSDPWAIKNQGATLRAVRQRLRLSADGLASKLRLGSNGGRTVRRWEAGEVSVSGPAQVAIELFLKGLRNVKEQRK